MQAVEVAVAELASRRTQVLALVRSPIRIRTRT